MAKQGSEDKHIPDGYVAKAIILCKRPSRMGVVEIKVYGDAQYLAECSCSNKLLPKPPLEEATRSLVDIFKNYGIDNKEKKAVLTQAAASLEKVLHIFGLDEEKGENHAGRSSEKREEVQDS